MVSSPIAYDLRFSHNTCVSDRQRNRRQRDDTSYTRLKQK